MAFGSLITFRIFSSLNQYPWARVIFSALLPQSLVMPWGSGHERGGIYYTDWGEWQYYTDHDVAQYRWRVMGLSLLVLGAGSGGCSSRYGMRGSSTRAKPRCFRNALPPILSIPIRLPGRLPAMICSSAMVPLAACGFLLAVLMAIASVPLGLLAVGFLCHGTVWFPVHRRHVVASSSDPATGGSRLRPRHFWRTRPISPDLWFWTKFVVGLAAVVGLLDGVTISSRGKPPRAEVTTLTSWAYVCCFPIIHALNFARGTRTCWFRRPVIGGILAILGYNVLNFAITAFPMTSRLEPIDVFGELLSAERAGQVDFTRHGYPLVYGVLVVSIVVLALVSSRLARPLQPASRWFVPHPESE